MCSPGRTAITELVYRYAELIDGGDFAGVGELFARGAIEAGAGEVRGAQAVRDMYAGVIVYDDGTPRTAHVTTNLQIEVDEQSGTGTCRSIVTVFQRMDDFPLQPVYQCRYHDTFVRDADTDAWHFERRRMFDHRPGDTARHLRG